MKTMVVSAQWHSARLPDRQLTHFAVALAALALLVSAQNASATTIVLSPVVDQSAEDADPRDGVFERLFPEDERDVRVFNGTRFSEIRGVLEFRLPHEDQLFDLLSAMLQLHATAIGHGEVPELYLRVDAYAGDGVVEFVDFGAQNIVANLQFDSNTYGVPPLAINVTSFVRDSMAAGDEFVGFLLRTAPGVTFDFASDESEVGVSRPTLHFAFVAVSEPTTSVMTLPIFAAGLVFLLVRRRRARVHPAVCGPGLRRPGGSSAGWTVSLGGKSSKGRNGPLD